MPHFHIDYSPNLEDRLDIAGLCVVLRDAAMETGVFPLAGVRIRATACTHIVMADGNPDHAFLDLSIRLRAGRSDADKTRALDHIFDAAHAYCAEVMTTSSFMLSCEMRDIDADFSRKASSIRDHLQKADI